MAWTSVVATAVPGLAGPREREERREDRHGRWGWAGTWEAGQ